MEKNFELLKKQLSRRMLPHAYLFSGTDEEAKEEALEYILENVLGKDFKTSPDFYEIRLETITVDDIREIKSKASQTPLRDKKNVFLIRNIERLSRDASPALLKLLEEPPAQCLILATTKHKDALLPTLRSRFSHLRFFKDIKTSDFRQIESIQKIAQKDRPAAIEKQLKGESPEQFLAEALEYVSMLSRKNQKSENIKSFENLLAAYSALRDPTINKRLLAEYLTMVL